MKISILPFIICLLIFFSCQLRNKNSSTLSKNQSYLKSKKEFDPRFTSHFPKLITNEDYSLNYYSNLLENQVGLVLYLYNVSPGEIDSIKSKIMKQSYLGCYKSTDSCLLMVNRFETTETRENFEIPIIKDSTLVERDCYQKLYPIPNFIEYSEPDKTLNFERDRFLIYVLEALSGNRFKKFNLLPSPQMPARWKNGYSKGIAFSETKKTIIYWGIIW